MIKVALPSKDTFIFFKKHYNIFFHSSKFVIIPCYNGTLYYPYAIASFPHIIFPSPLFPNAVLSIRLGLSSYAKPILVLYVPISITNV